MDILTALKKTDIYDALREYFESEGYEGDFDDYAQEQANELIKLMTKEATTP